jgi:hypothetical protein
MASVALSLIACCVPLAVHEYHMEASEHAPIGATNAEQGRPVAVQMTELIGCSLTGNQAAYTPHQSYNSSSGPYTSLERCSERNRQTYSAGFQEERDATQEPLDQMSCECRDREPKCLPGYDGPGRIRGCSSQSQRCRR